MPGCFQDDERVRKKWHQQVQNEIRSAEEAYTRYSLMRDEAIHRKDLNVIPRAKSLMSKWHPKLSQAISEQIPLWVSCKTTAGAPQKCCGCVARTLGAVKQ